MENDSEKIRKMCRFCENASQISDDEHMLCTRKGIVSCEYKCRRFSYDVMKHIPAAKKAPPPFLYIDIDSPDENLNK